MPCCQYRIGDVLAEPYRIHRVLHRKRHVQYVRDLSKPWSPLLSSSPENVANVQGLQERDDAAPPGRPLRRRECIGCPCFRSSAQVRHFRPMDGGCDWMRPVEEHSTFSPIFSHFLIAGHMSGLSGSLCKYAGDVAAALAQKFTSQVPVFPCFLSGVPKCHPFCGVRKRSTRRTSSGASAYNDLNDV